MNGKSYIRASVIAGLGGLLLTSHAHAAAFEIRSIYFANDVGFSAIRNGHHHHR